MRRAALASVLVFALGLLTEVVGVHAQQHSTREEFGGALFADRNLSISRTQSCISCHSPGLAFADPRELDNVAGAVSRGADRRSLSLGDRNAQTLLYAHLAPRFGRDAQGRAIGGFFHDGRADTLEDQTGQPLLDPSEMAMGDKASIARRIRENAAYLDALRRLFGAPAVDVDEVMYEAISKAMADFLRGKQFAPFSSRYDRHLRGETQLTMRESDGRELFFGRARCATCHSSGQRDHDTFTGHRYFNLGIPSNRMVRALNGSPPGRIDRGLTQRRTGGTDRDEGQFKVPTLRNVAVTSPYMHNGVFQELRTAIVFHLRFVSSRHSVNPETDRPWDTPEVASTVETDSLATQGDLSDGDIDALVAFLATLTDERYEALLR